MKAVHHGAYVLALLTAACTTVTSEPKVMLASVVPPPVARPAAPVMLAKTEDFVIVRAQAGDTFAKLAQQYLNDASLADIVADANGGAEISTGQPLVVPLKAEN